VITCVAVPVVKCSGSAVADGRVGVGFGVVRVAIGRVDVGFGVGVRDGAVADVLPTSVVIAELGRRLETLRCVPCAVEVQAASPRVSNAPQLAR